MMAGLLDNAESLLRVPTRIGSPVPLSRMPQELASPEFAVAVGMLLYTHRTQVRRASEEQGLRAKLKAIFAGSWLLKPVSYLALESRGFRTLEPASMAGSTLALV